VKPPKQRPADVRPFESWGEVEKVAEATAKWGALVIFACATGLRPEEWIGLRWDDVNFKKRTCLVNKVVIDGQLRTDCGKSDSAFRTIMLPRRATDALKSLPRPIQSDALTFPAPRVATSTSITGASEHGRRRSRPPGWNTGPFTSAATPSRHWH
jgi:integrase